MINLQFNSLCPFCNKAAYILSNQSLSCVKCSFSQYTYIELLYNDNILFNIIIHSSYDEDDTAYSIRLNLNDILYLNYTDHLKCYQISNYVPDFNSLQELLSIINTLTLFS